MRGRLPSYSRSGPKIVPSSVGWSARISRSSPTTRPWAFRSMHRRWRKVAAPALPRCGRSSTRGLRRKPRMPVRSSSRASASTICGGAASLGLRGGGFLYTNRASVSLGLVVSSEDLSRKKVEIQEIQTRFRMHPAVQRLIRGGKVVEYSAHLVPELGAGMMPRLSGDGILVVGDAAGFLINNRYTFRGVDLAIASGVAAGEAAGAARAAGGLTGADLAVYEKFLRARKVLTDLERVRPAPLDMKNETPLHLYPRMLMEIAERMYTVDGAGKERLFEVVLDEAASAGVPKLKMLLDLLQGARSM